MKLQYLRLENDEIVIDHIMNVWFFDSEEARGEMKIQDRLVQVDNDRFGFVYHHLLFHYWSYFSFLSCLTKCLSLGPIPIDLTRLVGLKLLNLSKEQLLEGYF